MLYYSLTICAASLLAVMPAFAQDDGLTAAPAAGAAADMSMYGEVRSVDTAANALTVQYYDYDSDEEKTAEITVSGETKFDGASALGDIRQNDWADVIYTVIDGKNMARSVIIEKEDVAEALPEETYGADADTEGEY